MTHDFLRRGTDTSLKRSQKLARSRCGREKKSRDVISADPTVCTGLEHLEIGKDEILIDPAEDLKDNVEGMKEESFKLMLKRHR